jgi:hypothetical protein
MDEMALEALSIEGLFSGYQERGGNGKYKNEKTKRPLLLALEF